MGEGEILNSTIDLPQASSTNRFSNFNPDRCVSTPQINVTGFIDDTFHNNREHNWKKESELGLIRIPILLMQN